MTISERSRGAVIILDIQGRITAQDGAPELRAFVRHLFHRAQLNLVINMRDVPYIDSTALGEIVRAHTTAIHMGGALKFLQVSGRVRDLLHVAKLLTVLEVFDSEEEAVASFGAASRT
jgi:anti-sigma B factor antagonist